MHHIAIPVILETIAAGLNILEKGKNWFYPDKTINEAEAILRKHIPDDVRALQEQTKAQRQVIDRMVEQLKANKEMIEKHNEVLINLSKAARQAVGGIARLRILSYWQSGWLACP
jgi:hypothetical protein